MPELFVERRSAYSGYIIDSHILYPRLSVREFGEVRIISGKEKGSVLSTGVGAIVIDPYKNVAALMHAFGRADDPFVAREISIDYTLDRAMRGLVDAGGRVFAAVISEGIGGETEKGDANYLQGLLGQNGIYVARNFSVRRQEEKNVTFNRLLLNLEGRLVLGHSTTSPRKIVPMNIDQMMKYH